MKFMMIIKSSTATEAGAVPSLELLDALGRFNEDMIRAGILRDAAGLMPSNRGARVTTGARPQVVHGPFAGPRDLVAGFWIIEVASLAEAVDWARRSPGPQMGDDGGGIEIRQMYEPEDFADLAGDALSDGPSGGQIQDRYGMPPRA